MMGELKNLHVSAIPGLPAMKQAVLQNRKGIEIGIGSERFAAPQHIEWAVEPSAGMAVLAGQRSINAFNAVAETLALEIQPYDLAKSGNNGLLSERYAKGLMGRVSYYKTGRNICDWPDCLQQ